MPIPDESSLRQSTAPNAILELMRRRISHVGLLVAFVSTLLTALVLFILCACASFR
jgi:hypothetical protein